MQQVCRRTQLFEQGFYPVLRPGDTPPRHLCRRLAADTEKMPLSSAFSYKGITVIWALIWGKVFFGENLTFNKALGALLVISGIVLYAYGDRENE